MRPSAVLIRRVREPLTRKGELLAIFCETRSETTPTVVVYSATDDRCHVERHGRVMRRTSRANPDEVARVLGQLETNGEKVRVLQASPRVRHENETDD